MLLNKSAIAASFSRAAPTYDRAAEPQRRMAEQLATLLPSPDQLPCESSSGEIVELGCGTGLLTERLVSRYPRANLHAIDLAPGMIKHISKQFSAFPNAVFEVADAEFYSPPSRASLVASNCTFQWLTQPEETLRHICNYLLPGGLLALGVMLDGSLMELAVSYEASVGRPMPRLPLWDESRFRNSLRKSGFHLLPSSRAANITMMHGSPIDMLRALKEIGANHGADSTPLTAGEMRRLEEAYRSRYTDPATGRVAATWRAFFILAERA